MLLGRKRLSLVRIFKSKGLRLFFSVLITILSPIIAFIISASFLEFYFGKSESGSTDWALGYIAFMMVVPIVFVIIITAWLPWIIGYIKKQNAKFEKGNC